jgi:hypothetical protein
MPQNISTLLKEYYTGNASEVFLLKQKQICFAWMGGEMFLKDHCVNQLVLGQANKHDENTIGTSLLPNPAYQQDLPLFPILFFLPTLFCFAK